MVARGGTSPWALVLLGEASAYPHGSGKPQAVKRGEVVLIDTGCAVRGYQSDISRSFVFGADPTPSSAGCGNRSRRARRSPCRPRSIGATAGSVDDAVRAAYTRWGYGPDYKLPGLSHRTGHGIGMEGHEPVNLVHGETTRLAPGMCFSNEPGIYLPGKFGIRLEDCFHMTAAGPRWFSIPPRSIDEPVGCARLTSGRARRDASGDRQGATMTEVKTRGFGLQWQMLIGFLVGLAAGLIANADRGGDAAWVERSPPTSPGRSGRSSCACCSCWSSRCCSRRWSSASPRWATSARSSGSG